MRTLRKELEVRSEELGVADEEISFRMRSDIKPTRKESGIIMQNCEGRVKQKRQRGSRITVHRGFGKKSLLNCKAFVRRM